MALLRALRLPSLFALLPLLPLRAERGVELDAASDSVFMTHRAGAEAHAAPAISHEQSGSFLGAASRALRSKTTAAGLALAVGSKLVSELHRQGIDIPKRWSRCLRWLHRDGSVARTRDMDTCEGWDMAAWQYALPSLLIAGLVACMVRRSRRSPLYTPRAGTASGRISARSNCSTGTKSTCISSMGRTYTDGRRSARTSTGSSAWGHEDTEGEFDDFDFARSTTVDQGIHGSVASITDSIAEAIRQKKAKRKTPLQLKSLAPWGGGLVQQRKSWFEDTYGFAEPEQVLNAPAIRNRPTGDEIDEMSRQATEQQPAGPLDDMFGLSRQVSINTGGALKDENSWPGRYFSENTGTLASKYFSEHTGEAMFGLSRQASITPRSAFKDENSWPGKYFSENTGTIPSRCFSENTGSILAA